MKRVFWIGLVLLAVGAVAYAAQVPAPFSIRATFDGKEIMLQSDDGTVWEATYTLSSEHPGPLYIVETGVGSASDLLRSDGYCFSIELAEGGFVMRSVRGTNWSRLSYSCSGTTPCEFVISESGVRGGL